MKALLLAAGLGTRLRPITDIVPKCLVPINGIPLLEYWLKNLSQAGVDRFLINTHYRAEQVNRYVKRSPFKDSIELVHEDELLLTGGTLLKNQVCFNDAPFMLIHADNLCFCDFKAFIRSHHQRPKGTVMTMMTFIADEPQKRGIVNLDKKGVVIEFFEKVQNPPGNLANGAVYIIEPEVIKFLRSMNKAKIDFSTEVLPKYIGKINTFQNDVYHRDIGSVEEYALSQVEVVAKELVELRKI